MAQDDELFRPTLQDHPGIAARPAQKPWRLGSQLWVAFFGGALAVAAIATLNAQRLGMSAQRTTRVFAFGLGASLVGLLTLCLWIASQVDVGGGSEANRIARYAWRGFGLAVYAVLHRMQRQADALYRFNHQDDGGSEYASLWLPGAAAVAAGSLVQAAVVGAVLWLST